MARQRITDLDVNAALAQLRIRLRQVNPNRPEPVLHLGNSEFKITNKLVIGKVNVWADGMAGHTKREAYNALRLMTSGIALADPENLVG